MKKHLIIGLISLALIAPTALWAETESASNAATVKSTVSASVSAKSVASNQVKFFPNILKKGQENDDVSNLQEILKSDPSVYPEGLVTGYYGTLTEKAVKKLQNKYGLPETGVLDDATQMIIFPPKIELTILAPNGGENWDKSETQTILWESKTGPVILNNQEVIPESSSGAAQSSIAPEPFFTRASLDLIRDSGKVIYHIATVNLYNSQYNWSIPARIPGADDYRVRISVGGNVPCLYRLKGQNKSEDISSRCPMYYPIYSASDTSDSPFSIIGTTPPSPEIIAKMKALVNQMENTLNNLLREIQSLKALLQSL